MGYVYYFEIYDEKGNSGPSVGCTAQKNVTESGFVVLRLCNDLQKNKY